jgi:hypothetical protein
MILLKKGVGITEFLDPMQCEKGQSEQQRERISEEHDGYAHNYGELQSTYGIESTNALLPIRK